VQYLNAGGGADAGGLTNLNYYYIVFANSSGIKVSDTRNGTPITVTGYLNPDGSPAGVHVFNRMRISNNALFFVVNTTPNTLKLSRSLNGSPINITANGTASGADTAGHFLTNLTKTIEE
jgi:hypothetical protein